MQREEHVAPRAFYQQLNIERQRPDSDCSGRGLEERLIQCLGYVYTQETCPHIRKDKTSETKQFTYLLIYLFIHS